MKRTLVIVGLGLIGGSLALALKGFEDFEIVGVDVSQPTLRYAAEHGVGDRVTEKAADVVPKADVVALALHPQGIVDFLAQYREQFKPGALVWDVCGIKTAILEAAEVLLLFDPRPDLPEGGDSVLRLYDEEAPLPPLLLPPALEDQLPQGLQRPQLLAALVEGGVLRCGQITVGTAERGTARSETGKALEFLRNQGPALDIRKTTHYNTTL